MRLGKSSLGITHDERVVYLAKRQVLLCDLLARPNGHNVDVCLF